MDDNYKSNIHVKHTVNLIEQNEKWFKFGDTYIIVAQIWITTFVGLVDTTFRSAAFRIIEVGSSPHWASVLMDIRWMLAREEARSKPKY